MWPGLTEEERTMIAQQEENAIQNQLVLFINRIIALRTPLEVAAGKNFAGLIFVLHVLCVQYTPVHVHIYMLY